ncbi:hypothetical protein HOK68_01225 [Candidatus Woesearchaeota archaeon]|jgi:hypothetical protein|nr:hypothetical protein [Candidatus Woesearchaeota archaeon]MBT4387644.1 hypothetical protein [Candidatus Woesearchaeota archaeon]MBT4595993.1 hypothetical protein [Candidatus Woesearchaeota archaeon]MBT5741018.1 hypothetical protein [Candidatus Woesearchaeota archaeon]MBT6505382.1 hypothetical protein [Candidatus Woesearchaeota archaeon]
MDKIKGWKPIPISLKIIFVLFILWIFGSIMSISMRYELGLPFFGNYISGFIAALIVFLLDILGPILFLYGLWNRKSWTNMIAYIFISIFVLNSVFALIYFRELLGIMPIVIPALVYLVFMIIINLNKNYFE